MTRARRTMLTPFFAAALLLGAFFWYAQATETAGGLVSTVKTSAANIPHLFSDDNKSADTSAALFFAANKSPLDTYQSYVTDAHHTNRAVATEYIPNLADDTLPLTAQGHWLRQHGFNPAAMTTWRQYTARFLQLLAVGGVAVATYTLFRNARHKTRTLQLDAVCVCWAGMLSLTLLVILPNFSLNYGILRAFHQAMLFLLLPMTLLLVRCGRFIWQRLHTAVATGCMVLLFLLFTGFFAQVTGGVSATLSLNNRGLYHGLYYTTQADLRTFSWLKNNLPHTADVRAASYAPAMMHDPSYPFTTTDILPMQVRPSSYIFLSEAQLQRQRLYVNYDGGTLIMTFPLAYYQNQTNKIYSTGSTGVYH